ncbi:hypothetical protein [Planobispora longispora]|nr:hypothetical protein GCM10020093_117900 [Planobispora longispora]
MPVAPPPVVEPVRRAGDSVHAGDGVYGVNARREGSAAGEKSASRRQNYGVIPLGPPSAIAAELRARLSREDLETLVELLSASVAR